MLIDLHDNYSLYLCVQDENGLICYRPGLNENAFCIYYLNTELKSIGYQAKMQGKKEFLIDKWKEEADTSSIMPYGLVDLDSGIMYGLKVNCLANAYKLVD